MGKIAVFPHQDLVKLDQELKKQGYELVIVEGAPETYHLEVAPVDIEENEQHV